MSYQRQKRSLGEAISIEDALAMLTVIFVLFILFMVPLVNIDRMKLEKAQLDDYWGKLGGWLSSQVVVDSLSAPGTAAPYRSVFGLEDSKVLLTRRDSGLVLIEAVDATGGLTIVSHRSSTGTFIAMHVKGHSSVASYRWGKLRWSRAENAWFAISDSVDYGERSESKAMKQDYRRWTLENRGF